MLERHSRDRPQRRRLVARVLLGVLLLALAFLGGIAFARTIDERNEQGGVVTNVRTLAPLPQEPPARTVTVTVTSP
ncbi:MAG: hypothetical protein H0U05_05125 [Actinobacteria bacterium]|nr:hypothetical protein [Actinomycetota bacterium]